MPWAAWGLALFQVFFIINVFASLKFERRAAVQPVGRDNARVDRCFPAARRAAPSCASSPSSLPGTCTTPGPDGRFGRTDLVIVSADNPLGLDRTDPAARDDVTTVNELHVPVNRPAIVYLSSKDVAHSFTLPQMRVKQDAIPGTVQPVWFTPTESGEWEIACSQLCGLAHYRMRGRYLVETAGEFDPWLNAQ